ncbi:MAG: hypothetical protein RR185_09650, partial [Angelakisella sp.]
MKKAKERLDAEAAHPMTGKQKAANFWFYYRWWIFIGLFAAMMAGIMIYDVVTKVDPDYNVAILSPSYFSPETITELETTLQAQVEDRNGDGKIKVTVLHYQLGIGEDYPVDPNTQMAATTRYAGDMQMGDSIIFLSDHAVEYQKMNESFIYNDGTIPPEGGEPNVAELGVPMSDCAVFDEMLAKPRPEKLSEFRVL